MIENSVPTDSDEGEIKSDFEDEFQDELRDSPHILRFIQKMRDHIKKQNKKIAKLRNKLNEHVRITFFFFLVKISIFLIF